GQDRAGEHDHRAAQGEAEPPAVPHLTNDVDELRAWVHVPGSPFEKTTGTFLYATDDSRWLFPPPAAGARSSAGTTTDFDAARTPRASFLETPPAGLRSVSRVR